MRFCAEQEADAIYATERFRDLRVAFGVKVGGGDVEMGRAGETDCCVSQESVDGICDRFALVSVEGEFGFARRIDWTAGGSRRGGVGNVWVCHWRLRGRGDVSHRAAMVDSYLRLRWWPSTALMLGRWPMVLWKVS